MVIWHITMSLDGFIAGPGHTMDFLRVLDSTEPNPIGDAVRDSTGAVLAGRNWYDAAVAHYNGRDGIYGGKWHGPVYVLTHEPPADPEDSEIHFLFSGVEEAVAAAQQAAGERNLGIFGANIARQCLDANLLDEIIVHVAPILLGAGIHLYDTDGAKPVALELVESDRNSLRYRVSR